MVVLGIDPGQSGGLAVVDRSRQVPKLVAATRMPTLVLPSKKKVVDARTVAAWLGEAAVDIDAVVIEQVSSRPGQGVASTFQFGRSLGAIEAMAYTLPNHPPIHYVTPAKWKKSVGLPTGATKQMSISLAKLSVSRAEPELKYLADDGKAEAMLISLAL